MQAYIKKQVLLPCHLWRPLYNIQQTPNMVSHAFGGEFADPEYTLII